MFLLCAYVFFCNLLMILLSYVVIILEYMFTSDNNQTARSLSWLIRNRFIAVSSVYGILSPLQSVGSIKESIWSTFAQSVLF